MTSGVSIKPPNRAAPRKIQAGKLAFRLHGRKLKGDFALVLMRGRGADQWLLIKSKDQYARFGWVLEPELPGDGDQPPAEPRRAAQKTSAAKKTPANGAAE